MFQKDILKGKRILVTGGGTGLGKEMASEYAELGAEVYICGRRQTVLDETVKEITDQGGKIKGFACDIRVSEAVNDMIDTIWNDGGALTGLVNNAAGNFISPTEMLSPNAFKAVIDIVLMGTWNCISTVGKEMIKNKKGNVLSIVTTYAWTGSPYVVPSAAAKAGVLAMTRSLAVEWGKHNIRFNACLLYTSDAADE